MTHSRSSARLRPLYLIATFRPGDNDDCITTPASSSIFAGREDCLFSVTYYHAIYLFHLRPTPHLSTCLPFHLAGRIAYRMVILQLAVGRTTPPGYHIRCNYSRAYTTCCRRWPAGGDYRCRHAFRTRRAPCPALRNNAFWQRRPHPRLCRRVYKYAYYYHTAATSGQRNHTACCVITPPNTAYGSHGRWRGSAKPEPPPSRIKRDRSIIRSRTIAEHQRHRRTAGHFYGKGVRREGYAGMLADCTTRVARLMPHRMPVYHLPVKLLRGRAIDAPWYGAVATAPV